MTRRISLVVLGLLAAVVLPLVLVVAVAGWQLAGLGREIEEYDRPPTADTQATMDAGGDMVRSMQEFAAGYPGVDWTVDGGPHRRKQEVEVHLHATVGAAEASDIRALLEEVRARELPEAPVRLEITGQIADRPVTVTGADPRAWDEVEVVLGAPLPEGSRLVITLDSTPSVVIDDERPRERECTVDRNRQTLLADLDVSFHALRELGQHTGWSPPADPSLRITRRPCGAVMSLHDPGTGRMEQQEALADIVADIPDGLLISGVHTNPPRGDRGAADAAGPLLLQVSPVAGGEPGHAETAELRERVEERWPGPEVQINGRR
ncbi:hypothetical protein [Corynebacterium sp.]|uniref:hypothetical protein n=1 Tax=Corynebacterium sp. TaxID=1720 RepID=UPI0026DF7131|nr:hypothetical protein [Corynebacterium sp.]MDO5512013.1 hypothetical protein [Corynebacterium sp.]